MTKPLTLDLGEEARNARTDRLLAHWRGHKQEWSMLFGVLCMDHGSVEYRERLDLVFNNLRIAARLDELRVAAVARDSKIAQVIGGNPKD